MPSDKINDLKCKLSESYISALVSKLNYSIEFTRQQIDNEGIDCFIKKPGGGMGVLITVQLKSTSLSSTSMISLKNNHIHYKLDKSYNNIAPPAYLFLVIFPPEEELESWCEIREEELLMRKCAYYMKLPLQQGRISIPKTNILNEITLPKLFIPSSEKEQNF